MTAYTIRSVIQHNTTKSLIDGVVRWLLTEPSLNDAEWQAHTDLVQACLEKMAEMSESNVNPLKRQPFRTLYHPCVGTLNRAMPHVQSMLMAMWEHDRTRALAHGRTTLRRLCPGSPVDLVFRSRKNSTTEALSSS